MRDLTEDEVLQAIRAANLGGNTIRLTFDSGPYEVTRSTRVADLLAKAIVRKFCEVNGIAGVAVDATPEFSDPRVQTVYKLLCDDAEPPKGEHWEGFVARRIVAALGVTASSQQPIHQHAPMKDTDE